MIGIEIQHQIILENLKPILKPLKRKEPLKLLMIKRRPRRRIIRIQEP